MSSANPLKRLILSVLFTTRLLLGKGKFPSLFGRGLGLYRALASPITSALSQRRGSSPKSSYLHTSVNDFRITFAQFSSSFLRTFVTKSTCCGYCLGASQNAYRKNSDG